MKRIDLFEQAIENKVTHLSEAGINTTLFWAYRTSKEAGNERIDFDDCIWEEDVEVIAAFFKANGIDEFTISNNATSLIDRLAEFEKQGFKIAGITTVNEKYPDFVTGCRKKKNAILMRLS